MLFANKTSTSHTNWSLRLLFLISLYTSCHGVSLSESTTSSTLSTKRQSHHHHHLESLPKIAPLLGESAIIDKETGRVYWQGGEQSLFHSTIGHTYFKNSSGLARHVRSTFYSVILWISVVRVLSQKILLFNLDLLLSKIDSSSSSIILNHKVQSLIKAFIRLLRIFVLCIVCLPKFNKWFLIVIGIFYLVESYTCSTRKYLDNVSTPEDVELYLENMKEQKPCVTWDIRCFHYERRRLLCMLLLVDLWTFLYNLVTKRNVQEGEGEKESLQLGPSIFTKKVVSHQTSQYYKFNSWEDETIVGIWKQSEVATSINTDFTKISIYKLLLLANSKARADYFRQQSNFVSREGHNDVYAELSTKVEVQGYRKKILVKKRKQGLLPKIFSIQYYWLFTFLLLTVPFRIYFARYCDELHVTLAKETSMDIKKEVETSTFMNSWFSSPKSWFAFMTPTGSNQNESKDDALLSKDEVVENVSTDKMDEGQKIIINDVDEKKKNDDKDTIDLELENSPSLSLEQAFEESNTENKDDNDIIVENDSLENQQTQVVDDTDDKTPN